MRPDRRVFMGATCAVILIVLAGSPTGNRIGDLMWVAIAGVVLGVAGDKAFERGHSMLLTVIVVLVASGLRLPGPFGLETVFGVGSCAWVVVRGFRRWGGSRMTRAVRLRLGLATSVVLLAVLGLASVTAWRMASVVREARIVALNGVDSIRASNFDAGLGDFRKASTLLDDFHQLLESPGGRVMAGLPIVGQQREYAARTIGPLRGLIAEGIAFAETRPAQAMRFENGRLDLNAARKVGTSTETVSRALDTFLDAADPGKSPWLLKPLVSPIEKVVTSAANLRGTLRTTQRVLKELPWLLGEDAKRTFLVPILTPVENRSGGGFPGAYAVMTAKAGKIRIAEYGSIGNLNRGGNPERRIITYPRDYVARYERYGAGNGVAPAKSFIWSNVTASPDHKSVSQVMAQLYPQSGGSRIDGVVSMDVRAMADILAITGPVQIKGETTRLSSSNAEQYLLRDQYFNLGSVTNEERRDRLYGTAGAIAERLTTMALPGPTRWTELLGPAVKNGNIRMWFTNPPLMGLVRSLGADGEFGKPSSVASIAVTNTNGGPNKIDMFLTKTIKHRVKVSNDGDVSVTTDITLRNDAPPRGYDRYVLGNVKGWPNGSNVMILNYYSPLLDCSATIDGKEVGVPTEMELGWFVHSLYFGVAPRSTAKVSFRCAGTIDEARVGIGNPRVRGQVGANDDTWDVDITAPEGTWAIASRVNSNSWIEVPR